MGEREVSRLLGDLRTLIVLFIAFRVVLLLAYPPFLTEQGERGIGVGGDRQYHYVLSSLAEDNLYPFRDWWSEFPPVWYLTTTSVYVLLGDAATYHNWSLVLGILMIASEVGILILMHRMGSALHGEATGIALAWIYALLALPMVFMWWNFDTLVTFFLLLGIWLVMSHSNFRAAFVIAFGALTKFIPLLIFGAVIRFFTPRRAARLVALTVVIFAAGYVPLFLINPEFSMVSLTAQFGKPSYQTVWALLDGNYTTGNFGTIESHLTAEGVNDGLGDRNPAVVPGWLRFGMAGLIGLGVYIGTRRTDKLGFVAFVGITLLIFYLQSQGFSPQWLTAIIPLLLLVYPTRNAIYTAVMLSVLAFVEYPFLFVRTGDGVFDPESPLFLPWVVVVCLRTGLMVAVAIAFYRKLVQQPNPELAFEATTT